MKRILALLSAIILTSAALLCACGEKSAVEVNLNGLAGELIESGAFSDLLSPLDKEVAAMLFELDADDIDECALYCSTGATAEEIALFLAPDSEAASRIADAVAARVEYQVSSFESYVPEELPKLESAVVKKSGRYVFLCVAQDSVAAESVISGHLGL